MEQVARAKGKYGFKKVMERIQDLNSKAHE
jgi:hypothetical protein